MTLDEAIEYYTKTATQRAIADEEMGVNDKWNETKFMTKKESEQIIADNRQLVEWLVELKEAKRLLKAAVEYIEDGDCDYCTYNNDAECPAADIGCGFKWIHVDEALKLIGNEPNGI